MKSYYIFMIIIFNLGREQIDTPFLYPFELKQHQQIAWNTIQKEWYDKFFYNYLRKSKIKLSDCKTCGQLFIDVEVKIDANGKLTYQTLSAKNCRKDMSKDLEFFLMRYFVSKTFPKNLRNLKIKDRLGSLSKC